MLKNDITFETGCYEKDYRYILTDDHIRNITNGWHYPFSKVVIIINNVKDIDDAKRRADKLKSIDEYYVVSECEDKALEFFNVKKSDFVDGWKYSAVPLVGVYVCDTKWLLFCTNDVSPIANDSTWMSMAMRIMDEKHRIFVANPIWDWKHDEAINEAEVQTADWYVGYGFSDQCFLIKASEKEKIDLSLQHHTGIKYPKYASEHFEKKINAYMRNNGLLRITYKHTAYHHDT